MKRVTKTVAILVIVLFMTVVITIGCTSENKEKEKDNEGEDETVGSFSVSDGVNRDATHGCFFTIRAVKGVNINPSKYFFFVTMAGQSPKALDFSFRDYQDQGEDDLTPVGGDRNKSYRYDDKNSNVENMNPEAAGQMWSDGEYIGFDMPMTSMGIDIVEMGFYDVTIKGPSGTVVYQGSFTYQEQMYR